MSMQQWASLVSAITASVAAALTGVNLWLTGRRADLQWSRSALEAAFVDFLTASYNHRDTCNRIAALGNTVRSTEEFVELVEATQNTMLNCITRIRVLAGDRMAGLASDLHDAQRCCL